MNIVIAIDSFKGSLSSLDAGMAAAEGIQRAIPNAGISVRPIADGGEGTVEALCLGLGGIKMCIDVKGPLGEKVKAEYGLVPKSRTAIIEMSAAAGITLLSENERNPLNTTTYGVGEMIKHAIREHGCREFILGIGGSATNDGGIGMLSALGFSFLDANGDPIKPYGEGLKDLASINTENALPELAECTFKVACDVKNPLTGPRGCSAVFGPQKGADTETVGAMDAWLSHYAELTQQILPHASSEHPGAGAAGGMGYALLTYLNATLMGGIELVIEQTHLEEKIQKADLVITGEGRLDGQSCMGKAPVGVATCAKRYQKPVIAFAGAVTDDATVVNQHGIDAFFPILRAPCSLEDAMDITNAYRNLRRTAEQALRLWLCAKGN